MQSTAAQPQAPKADDDNGASYRTAADPAATKRAVSARPLSAQSPASRPRPAPNVFLLAIQRISCNTIEAPSANKVGHNIFDWIIEFISGYG